MLEEPRKLAMPEVSFGTVRERDMQSVWMRKQKFITINLIKS